MASDDVDRFSNGWTPNGTFRRLFFTNPWSFLALSINYPFQLKKNKSPFVHFPNTLYLKKNASITSDCYLQETCCAADCNALAIAAMGLSCQRLESLRLLACGVKATSIPHAESWAKEFDKMKPSNFLGSNQVSNGDNES